MLWLNFSNLEVYASLFADLHLDVSEKSGTPKSSILIGFSIINHPFWGTPIFWKHPFIQPSLDSNKIRTPQVASHSSVYSAVWPGMDLWLCHFFFGEQESGMWVWSHLPKKIWSITAPKKTRSHCDIYFRPSRSFSTRTPASKPAGYIWFDLFYGRLSQLAMDGLIMESWCGFRKWILFMAFGDTT